MNLDAKTRDSETKSNISIKEKIHHDEVVLNTGMQGWLKTCKSVNVICHITE
jgi:hypothetical protein